MSFKYDDHLRLGSVVTARQTREFPKTEATTGKESSKLKLAPRISPWETSFGGKDQPSWRGNDILKVVQ